MSGIVGILNLDGAPVERGLLEQMTRAMSFRGPDALATWSDGCIGFGHTLLRTTFESADAQQPATLDQQNWIVADARVDGQAELIRELKAQGRHVQPNVPDVELILHAYSVWGIKCVEHLIGDFIFAIWDVRTRTLFCARDHFGVVPFYYTQVGHTLLITNTLECLFVHPEVRDELNELAIADLLLFRTNQDTTTTTYQAIRRLPAAHCLTCADGTVRVQRYWALAENIEIQYRSAGDTVSEFQTLWQRAVQDRLRAERIAVPMSGGLDSSSLAVTAQQLLKQSRHNGAMQKDVLHAYTLTADHLMPDQERYYAGLVAAYADIPIQYHPYTLPDTLQVAERIAPEPGYLPNSNAVTPEQPHAPSRVLLSGAGGDPLLFPSRTFLLDLLRRGQFGRFAYAVGKQWQLYGRRPPVYALSALKRKRSPLTQPALPRWLNPSFVERYDLAARWQRIKPAIESQDQRRAMAESAFWQNFFGHCDPGFTGQPMKIWFPYFDVRLLKFAVTVPPVPWFLNKAILREAMRGKLPEEVRLRPKTPLHSNPLLQRAQQQPFAWMSELAATPELESFVNRTMLRQIIKAPTAETALEFNEAQTALALGYWLALRRTKTKILAATRDTG